MSKSIAIIGGGAAGLAFASHIDTRKYDVTIYERNKALGRKFLVAGKGGFNLTHGEHLSEFVKKYSPSGFLDRCLAEFTNEDLRRWLESLGISTYVGTSNRVFPIKGIKPIEVLKVIENHILSKGVHIEHEFIWNGDKLADITIYALGGASWPVTGSDGTWTKHFHEVVPFKAMNCAFEVDWPSSLVELIEGKPLKNISLSVQDTSFTGEIMLTDFGIEGGVVYAASERIQDQLLENNMVLVTIDLKKDLTLNKVAERLKQSKGKNITEKLRKELKLSKQAVALLKTYVSKENFLNTTTLAYHIKNLQLELIRPAPIDEAISTMGGIPIHALTDRFELKSKPGHFCIGEMVDWNAPTGGYLLQACFSMGYYLATNLSSDHP